MLDFLTDAFFLRSIPFLYATMHIFFKDTVIRVWLIWKNRRVICIYHVNLKTCLEIYGLQKAVLENAQLFFFSGTRFTTLSKKGETFSINCVPFALGVMTIVFESVDRSRSSLAMPYRRG